MSEKLDINALFLGSKAENSEIFEKLMLESFRDHIFWRRNFHPEDPSFLTQSDKRSPAYGFTIDSFMSKFYELLSRLKCSVPFHSPRYLGHMTADILMPAMIGYFSTMLYNPNNVCYESSPVGSKLETEVGMDLAGLIGFDPERSWAHLTSGGTVANIEALWVIRNIKYFPLIARDLVHKYKKNLVIELPDGENKNIAEIDDDYTLLSLSPEGLSDLSWNFFNLDWGIDIQEEVYKHKRNISHAGMGNIPVGKILVPASKHYSWPKAAEILGMGRSNIEHVKVDKNFRMDEKDLKEKLQTLYEQKIPVLSVIGIVGTTECGSIDPIDKIIELRKWYEKERNSSFYIHIDGAYGGYPRSIFIEEDNKTFRPIEEIQQEFVSSQFLNWPCQDIYNAYKAVSEVDSFTVDPHKFGYIPYPAGVIIYRDKRIKPATLCKAPYIDNVTKSSDEHIGEYILEGSKPGASAAACWLAHRIIPLNKNGYGKIISTPVENAHILFDMLTNKNPIEIRVKDKTVKVNVKILNKPDLDILLYLFNIQGNKSLKKMNKLNQRILEEFSFHQNIVTGAHEFLISATDLGYEVYGDSVIDDLKELGIDTDDWTTYLKLVKVLRSSVVTPLVNKAELKEFYWNNFFDSIVKALEKILDNDEFLE